MQENPLKSTGMTGEPLRRRIFFRHEAPGFTLVELMISIFLGLMVLGVLYQVLTAQNNALSRQEQVTQMQQQTRMAMDVLLRDLRMAGYDPKKTGNFGLRVSDVGGYGRTTGQSAVAFTCDNDGSGTLDVNDDEMVAYRVAEGELQRFHSGTLTWSAVVEQVDSLSFTYQLRNGASTTTPSISEAAEIVSIDVALTLKTALADPDYVDPSSGDHYRRYTMTSRITPRNLSL
jgi:type IV pilus assembly protein PilW